MVSLRSDPSKRRRFFFKLQIKKLKIPVYQVGIPKALQYLVCQRGGDDTPRKSGNTKQVVLVHVSGWYVSDSFIAEIYLSREAAALSFEQ